MRFLTYLVAALQKIDGDIDQIAQSLLGSPQLPPVEPLVVLLVNDIAAAPTPLALVLDDYHSIHTQWIHDATDFLLQHQSPNVHLVLATREAPPVISGTPAGAGTNHRGPGRGLAVYRSRSGRLS